jgi:hypothetical protein
VDSFSSMAESGYPIYPMLAPFPVAIRSKVSDFGFSGSDLRPCRPNNRSMLSAAPLERSGAAGRMPAILKCIH